MPWFLWGRAEGVRTALRRGSRLSRRCCSARCPITSSEVGGLRWSGPSSSCSCPQRQRVLLVPGTRHLPARCGHCRRHPGEESQAPNTRLTLRAPSPQYLTNPEGVAGQAYHRFVSVRVQWVRYGRDAAEALRAAVAAIKGDEPLAPVTVVVPSNHVGVATRRLLASGALGPVSGRGVGLAAVTFVTPYRMAELLGAPILAAAGRRPVSTPVIAAALRAALQDDAGLFAPVADHPATETALVAAYRELRDLSAAALDALAGTSRRAGDVVRLHRAARDRLAPDWYDEEDLMAAGTTAIAQAADLGKVIIYLPQRLSLHAATFLRTIDVTVLAGTTADSRADTDVIRSLNRLGHFELSPLESGRVASTARTRILTASDAEDEVRAAVRAVIDAVRSGTPLDRIAILHASPEPYARLAHEQLSAAEIPTNGASVIPLSARVTGRTLLQLLALAEGGFRRAEVFAWLAGAPLLHEGRWVPTTAWERLSRDAGIVSGRKDWDCLLARLVEDHEARAELADADPEAPPGRAERERELAERARGLRSFVLALMDELDKAAAVRQWSDHARWARHQLEILVGDASRRGRNQWPTTEAKAAERVESALDRLATLDAVEGPVGLDVFARTLELELEADLGRVGRFGEGVFVGPVGMGVGLDLDLVIVLGLAEGAFPAWVRDDSLLPDHERTAAGGELPLRAERIEREHRELLAALAGATRQLLCVPRGDLRRSSTRVPSRWVLALASELEGRRWWSEDLLRNERPWLTHVASFDAGLRRVAFPATEQEYRLCSLLASARSGVGVPDSLPDTILAAAVEAFGARRSDRFTRFDGNLAGLILPSPAAQPTSATRLEAWAICPFAYLVHEVLAVEPVENPEDQLEITATDRGSLIHEVLERFIVGVLARRPAGQVRPDHSWSEADRERLLAITDEVCARYEAHGLTGRPIFWRRDRRRIVADLLRFLAADSEHRREHGTRPVAAELAFGVRGSDLDAVPLRLPDGRSVRFRGRADRVDVADDGTLHVVDYKTGKSQGYTDLSEEEPDLRGRKLQLAVYGAAARRHHGRADTPVRAEYWFVSTKGKFKRIGYPVTPAVLGLVGETLGTMVEGIENGVFPNHPTAVSTTPWVECWFCDPDNLGVTELRRHWDRKRMDPALALFADLAEPLAAIETETEVVEGV
jgi:ATP-dependent helicase/nuclease subunit B